VWGPIVDRVEDSEMIRRHISLVAVFVCACPATQLHPVQAAPRSEGQLALEVVDSETLQPIAARIHLKNSRGRPVALKIPGTAEYGGHFYIDGKVTLPMRRGQYTFELDAGPEYRTQRGHFEIERHAEDAKRIAMKRFANLAREGWYAGDLDVSRQLDDLPLIMRAEALSVVPTSADQAPRQKRASTTHPLDAPPNATRSYAFGPFRELASRSGGDLLLFNLQKSSDEHSLTNAASLLSVMQEARGLDGKVVARTPYSWDLSLLLASSELDAIQLIHHHALRDGVLDDEKDGRPRDRALFPGRSGNGRWSETVYYHVLNCGLRIPPAAGSGSGTNDNPVGTNRVYVHCGEEFSYSAWWKGLQAGRVVVTNGPLLRPLVEGQAPGYVFRLEEGGSRNLEVGLDLATRVPVEYLQIVKNGQVAEEVRLADWTKRQGRLPKLLINASGWFLVRAITNNQQTYQFASSGPYYVEQAGQPRISRRSVQFFLDWLDAAAGRIREMPKLDDAERQALLAEQRAARQFFDDLLSKANAD
jgi:hypothetical protein